MKKVIFTIELVCEDSELRSCKLFSQLALHPGCIRVSSEDFKPLENQEYYKDSGPGYPVLYETATMSDFGKIVDEMSHLQAEIDRLTAMLGSQNILKAEQVTEPGLYWTRTEVGEQFTVAMVYVDEQGQKKEVCVGSDRETELFGLYIGPIKAP